jgi:hypothetical protein
MMACFTQSGFHSDHVHFIDGYASVARALKPEPTEAQARL